MRTTQEIIEAWEAFDGDDVGEFYATWDARQRLEELRRELEIESLSYAELLELQSLAEYIEPHDVQLLEAAGVPEFPCECSDPTTAEITGHGHACPAYTE